MKNKNQLKNYEVDITEVLCGFVRVKAKNKEDAKQEAYDEWRNGNAQMCGDCDLDIGTVTELNSK